MTGFVHNDLQNPVQKAGSCRRGLPLAPAAASERRAHTRRKHMKQFQLVATCLFGLEKSLGEELDALGLRRLFTMDGRVLFEGTPADIARANLSLRCAERVLVRLGAFPARSFEELFEGARALPWEEWIGRNDAFPVKGHAIRSQLHSVPDCQSILKKAIVSRLSDSYHMRWFPETGVRYPVEFFLFRDEASLMIDTSGVALHKRGYRPEAGAAPLRETLAAAMAMIARPRQDVLFWDPMCGSGTIAIEAAMILANRAPGLGRRFAGEEFPQLPPALWQQAREQAQAAVRRDAAFEVWASDIDPAVLDLAYENALRAGVEEHMRLFEADVLHIEKPDRRGTIVCNPPYGERLMTPEEVERLYRGMGRHFAKFDPWQIYILAAHPEFERLYGRRADKVRRLSNGMIPCGYYQYFRPAAARRPAH